MHDPITLESLSGAALLPHMDAVAALRIAMFDQPTRADLHASLAAIQPLRRAWMALYARLERADDHGSGPLSARA